jgi:hypothetical protein
MKINLGRWQLARVSSDSWRCREEQVCAASRLFDGSWYLQQNPHVAATGMNPLTHYIRSGAAQGLDPNPFFDTDWYLKQNPDVAAAGMNPLCHYIRWGAAKGLDPSPLFQTTWYLEQNPDVAAAGVNPLVHYIHWGAAELREPVSPVRRLFERLAIKRKPCAAELDRIVEIYSSPPNFDPERARGDNLSQAGVSWAELFMLKGVESYVCGDLPAALRFCKYAVQTVPYEDDPINLYFQLFAECNRPAIDAYAQAFAGASLLVLHVSHEQGLSQAERSCRSFHDCDGKIANLIVIGEDRPEDSFSFDRVRYVLSVPTRDSYEALPQKVAKALLFLGSCRPDLPIVKVDDDAICEDISKLKYFADEVLRRHRYGGRLNPRTNPYDCSFWHFGKCADQEINFTPDGLFSLAAYAGGQGYWMSAETVSAMSKISLIHERFFRVEYFEDRAIGAALFQYGVRPHHYDLVATGALRDTSQPRGLVKAPPARLRGSRIRVDAAGSSS